MSSVTSPWIFDADGHAVEPESIWKELLPARFHSYAPRALDFGDHFRFVCNDRIGFRIHARPESVGVPGETTAGGARRGEGAHAAQRAEGERRIRTRRGEGTHAAQQAEGERSLRARGGAVPGPRLEDMALDAIERAAVYPTYGLMIQGVTERAPALALCRAVNDWLADYCRAAPGRLLGIGTLPMVDPGDALAEARRCVEQLGMRGVWRRPEYFPGIARLHDPGHEALFAYLAGAGIPLAIHPGLNGVVPAAFYEERFETDYAAMHAAHFPVEQLMSLTEVIAFGILERHPGLRMALLECGATWALAHLHRLDEHAETFGFPRAELRLRPSEYFRRQCFVALEEPEPGIEALLRAYPESVVFASDYPHGDCTFPGSTKELLEAPALDAAARRRILRGNAERLYAA